MKKLTIYSLAVAVCCLLAPGAEASQFTPLAWQQPVESHGIASVVGQRKHTTWVRDKNRDFVDDLIEDRHAPGELVDVVVDINECLSRGQIEELLSRFGEVRYVGKLITFVFLDDVVYEEVWKIAALPEVAMVEIQELGSIVTDVSARSVQAKASTTFSPDTAADAGFDGSGITVAVLDTGVDDGHEQFTGKFVGGFNALIFEDTNLNGIDDSCEPAPLGNGICTDADDEPADGTGNPDDDQGHGSHVAGIALGRGMNGRTCSAPDDGSTPNNCAGVAPGAGLVDIKICDAWGSCPEADVAEALDWLGLHAGALGVRVANMSISFCTDDDGTNALSQQVNYLTSLGIVMVVAHGNASNCWLAAGTTRTNYPGSASFAVTVGGTDDRDTVGRGDDTNYSSFLRGPRNDFTVATPNLLALKPDLSAPGESIDSARYNTTTQYTTKSGTSMAAPHVAGASAVLLDAQPAMDPGTVKDLLKRTADTALNTAAFPAVDPDWDTAYGSGMLNLWNALDTAGATDVGFPTCSGAAPPAPGQRCPLSGGLSPWNNSVDIATTAPPQVGVANTITAQIENSGGTAATVLVDFGVYVFAAGNNQFFHIGTQEVTVPAGLTVTASQPWTPAASDHQCVQVSIEYGLDTNFDNNVTQRNLSVAPSVFKMRVENPLPVPAEFEIRPRSQRDDWVCKVSMRRFKLHPYQDCPQEIEITFDPPRDARVGERADCDIGVFARAENLEREVLVGGVTVQTFVPRPCRIFAWIRDARGNGIPGAVVRIEGERREPAISDREGVVVLEATPYRQQTIVVETEQFGGHEALARLYCGLGTLELVVTEKGLEVDSRQRQKDWHWDRQLLEGFRHRPGG